jgi:hypothetical protein
VGVDLNRLSTVTAPSRTAVSAAATRIAAAAVFTGKMARVAVVHAELVKRFGWKLRAIPAPIF